MNWNRQYRPQQVSQLHLDAVRSHFTALLKSGKFPQVFLFAGPKGTGKTSTARIVAALLNDPANANTVQSIFFDKKSAAKPLQEPDLENELVQRIFAGSSFMVQELDAASNRGIDDVRALKERITLPPQDGLISVYILDEVHMLTTEAFNALLKILEEPPPHVVFILATTELEKIPATVVSRAQVIGFTKATIAEITTALENILAQEKLAYEPDVLSTIAQQADGSFRDAVKLLEMIAQVGAITAAAATQVLSLSAHTLLQQLIEALLAKDPHQVVALFKQLRDRTSDQKQVVSQLLKLLHTDLLKAYQVASGTALWPAKTSQFLLKELSDPFVAVVTPIPFLPLELKFLEIIERSQKKNSGDSGSPKSGGTPSKASTASMSKPQAQTSSQLHTSSDDELNSLLVEMNHATHSPIATTPQPVPPQAETITQAKPSKAAAVAVELPSNPGDGQAICQQWVDIVAAAVKQNFGLATLLRSARPLSGELGKVVVSVYYSFHKEQLMQPKFKQQLDVLFANYAGGRIELECILAEQPVTAELHETPQAENLTELAVASLM